MSSPRKSQRKNQWSIAVLNRRDWNSYWKPVEEFLLPFSCALVPVSASDRAKLMIVEVEPGNLPAIKKILNQRQKLVIAVPLSGASSKKNLAFIDLLAETSRKHPCLMVSLDNRI